MQQGVSSQSSLFSLLLGLFSWQLMVGTVIACVLHCHSPMVVQHALSLSAVLCDSDVAGHLFVKKHSIMSTQEAPPAILPGIVFVVGLKIALACTIYLPSSVRASLSQCRGQPRLRPPRASRFFLA